MAMEEALVERLVAVAGVAGIAGDRISWFGRQRGDALPALTLSKISPGEEWNHSGPDRLDRPRVRFDCWSAEADDAAALGRAVKAEMRETAEVGGVRFHPAMLDAERWIDQGEQDGGELLFHVQIEMLFYFEETD